MEGCGREPGGDSGRPTYGGLDPLIALTEGFELPVVEVNEIGLVESRDVLFGRSAQGRAAKS
jgi:hypothetical protein